VVRDVHPFGSCAGVRGYRVNVVYFTDVEDVVDPCAGLESVLGGRASDVSGVKMVGDEEWTIAQAVVSGPFGYSTLTTRFVRCPG
jgi:hypothetical protein